MSFEAISTKIISESISTALYIDDKVLLPFEQNNKTYIDQSSLFNSFGQKNCLVDFKRYDINAPFDVTKSLYNKDLLILDWHLNSNESDLTATFEILEKAINTTSLHFSVVYTNQRNEDLPNNVILNIASYYSGLDKQTADNCRSSFRDFIDSTGLSDSDQNLFTEQLRTLTIELLFSFQEINKNKEINKRIYDLLNANKLKATFEEYLNSQNLPRETYKERLTCLGLILNNCEVPEVPKHYKINLFRDRLTIRVQNLYIKVFSKTIQDSELYDAFTKSLSHESNIFLTLLGLEIRNRFRETSAFIGKELDDIDPLAFFFHRKSHFDGYEELFNEFLKDIWKDQVASFLLEKDIELFSVLEEYKQTNDIDKKLINFKTNENSSLAIAKLNLVYNRLAIKRKENDEIRFGDIFFSDLGDGKPVYFLCLTPHCDCLRPGKIKSMFFFVEGKSIGISKGVMKGDSDFISFIHNENAELTCIDWTNESSTRDCKPFSLYIPNNRMEENNKKISFNYCGQNIDCYYLCTLKENYAQRISNKAFSYPLRVGIDFATLNKS